MKRNSSALYFDELFIISKFNLQNKL